MGAKAAKSSKQAQRLLNVQNGIKSCLKFERGSKAAKSTKWTERLLRVQKEPKI